MKRILSMAVCLSIVIAMVAVMFPMMSFAASESKYSGTVYYVDNQNGSDTFSGTSEATPFKTLDKVNALELNSGDAVLLRRGCVWSGGWLWPKGSGEEGKPITISSYGDENLPKPAIISNFTSTTFKTEKPKVDSAVYLANQSYVVIDGLDITNGTNSTNEQYGVRILTRDAYYTYGCVIKNCTISGSSKYDWADSEQSNLTGIACFAENYWSFIGSLNIENNEIYNCKALGISVNGAYGGCNSDGTINEKYSAKNVYIAGNYLQNIGKDGILVNNSIKPVVEYNTCNKSHSYAKTSYHVAMWPFSSYGALFQYNESYNTQTTYDASGFDCDYQCYYTTFQYNYSHDNQGGFMLICTEPQTWDKKTAFNVGVTVRYNISQNDSKKIFCLTCQIKDTNIYNNTIYVGDGVENGIYVYSRDGKKYPINTRFINNIIYAESGAVEWLSSTGTVWQNNIVYGAAAGNYPKNDNDGGASDAITASGNIFADPMLVKAGGAGIGIDNCEVYKLKSGSPAIGAGIAVADNGGKDYFGNAVGSGKVNIGAYNGAAVNAADITTHTVTAGTERVNPTSAKVESSVLYGDVNGNGVVNTADVLALRKYLAGFSITINKENSDVNGDGNCTTADVLLLRKHLAGFQVSPWA